MKNGSSLLKVLNLTNAPVTVYKTNKLGNYLKNKQHLVVNRINVNQKHARQSKWENTQL